MPRYVYYNEVTGQVEAEFSTPVLADQDNWVKRGFKRALVPEGMSITRDDKITGVNLDGYITSAEIQINPVKPEASEPDPLFFLHGKLAAGSITSEEIREMLRLERGL